MPQALRNQMDKAYIYELFAEVVERDDEVAFRQIYQRLFIPLFRFSLSLVKSKEAAEEIVQDVFLGLWKKRKQLLPVKDIPTYLFVSVKNRALNQLKKDAAKNEISLDELGEVNLTFTADPEQLLITGELLRKLDRTIAALPPKCRLIYMLVKQHGLKYHEVAQVLQLSAKTVENQLAIAMKKLVQSLSFSMEQHTVKRNR
ncbi:RNA polymerase sigma-70 factor [Compostibacter hankyongensis]|uniref:RNA polymerase sigma-70 factor n=1 Tax=Compostibacter hankyongensis TaxID=1007089 RepID=A0ABP8FVC2_9BACT